MKEIIIIPFIMKNNMIKINILEPPPGIDVMDWLNIVVDILIQVFWLNASKSFLTVCLQKLYAKYTPLGYYPSLIDLYEYINSLKIPLQSRLSI